MSIQESLSRTTLLVRRDIYPGLDDETIVRALTEFHVVIRADDVTASSAAGQTATVAAAILCAELGARISVQVPSGVPILGKQPPLNASLDFAEAVDDVVTQIQGRGSTLGGPTDVLLAIGGASARRADGNVLLRLQGDEWSARIRPGAAAEGDGKGWKGQLPFGPVMGAVMAAAEVFRGAMVKLGHITAVAAPGDPRIAGPVSHERSLPQIRPLSHASPLGLGNIDLISAGAIANATLFPLLRLDDIDGSMRIIDGDIVEESNLNRCSMFRRDDIGRAKAEVLAGHATAGLRIEPVVEMFEAAPSAGHPTEDPNCVVTGVDSIPVRWAIQATNPTMHIVGATSHFQVVVSEHTATGPCAGCLHPRDEPDDGPIPTISFVSALAGLLAAHRLVRISSEARGLAPAREPLGPTIGWGMALDERLGVFETGLSPNPRCPVHCGASRTRVDETGQREHGQESSQ